jgi:protein-L-isoaspartate(D-aspartate) O-methyltransferase
VPVDLALQLSPGGRLVLPVGTRVQQLVLVERTERGFQEQRLEGVNFVPLLPGMSW